MTQLSGCSEPSPQTGAIRLVNNSAYYVTSFYITPATAQSWGSNQLGGATIPPDSSYTVTGIPVGLYDLAANLSGYGEVCYYDAEVKGGYVGSWTLTYGRSVSRELKDRFEQSTE